MLRRFSIRRRRPSLKTFNVIALDGATLSFNLDGRSVGKDLLDKVLQECAITSADRLYFSLATQEDSYLKWILLHRPLKKQLSGHSPYTLMFRVYIYPYNHHSLEQSLTRHYLYLQVKQDLKQNRLQPSSSTATTRITSLMVQGEIGNYIPHTCTNGYIKELQILPALTTGMEEAIKQAHRLNRGRLPGECEEEVLDMVQDEPTYGSVYYSIQDSHRQPITLCVCPVGVRIAQGGRQINCFKWESITKVTSRGKHVYLQMDASQNLSSSNHVHYMCPNSVVSATVAGWCQTLLNFYCSIEQEDDEVATRSKLKRFFSTRRSLRRSTQVRRRAETHPASIPVQRRRGSLGVEIQTTASKGSPRQGSLTKREGSKLVIYGLSGLASSQEDAEPTALANGISEHGSTGLLEVSETVSSPDDRVQSSLQESIDNTLPVIEEEYGSNLNSKEGLREGHASPTKREGLGGNCDYPMGNHTPTEKGEGFGDHTSTKKGLGGSGDRAHPNKRFGDRTPPIRRDGIGGDRTPPVRRDGFGGERTPPVRRDGFGGDRTPPVRRDGLAGDRTPPTRREGYASPTKREGYPGSPTRRSSVGSPNRRDFAGDHHHHGSPTRRGEGMRVHHVPLADRENGRQARRLGGGSGGITGSMPLLKREPRRDGGGYEGPGYGKQRRDHKQWNSPPSVQGSVGDMEHKSVASVFKQRQQRHGSQQPPPPLPPRAFSESEIPMEGRGYEYDTEHRVNQANYHYRGPSGSTHSGGGVVSPSHYVGGYSNHVSSQLYNTPKSPQYSSQSPYPPTPSPQPDSPHHRQPYHNYPYGRTSPYNYQAHLSGGGGGGNEIKRHSPQHHNNPRSHEDNLSPPHHHHHHHHQPPPPRYSPLHTSGHSTRPGYHPRGDDHPHSRPSYRHQHSSSSQGGGEELALSYESYRDDIMSSRGGNPYSNGLKKGRGVYHSTPGIRGGDVPRYTLQSYRRRNSQGDTGTSENWWDYRQGDQAYSPAASSGGGGGGGGGGERSKHFRYPANQGGTTNRNPQGWKGGQRPPNGTWQEQEEDTVSHTSSSLPLHTDPNYSLYEEDEEIAGEDRRGSSKYLSVRSRTGSYDQASLNDSRRHVPRHIRLRHSTITSLTSLPDINGSMSRLGSIASLDYQASFAELSQSDSISGYIDPHVRSLVFEASQNSQGTEL